MAQGFVVVGLDGSPSSEAALDWAVAEARMRGLAIRIVSAHEDVPGSGAEGRRLLAAAASRVAAEGVAVETDLVAGPPAQALLSSTRDAAVLVLGVRGIHGARHLRLGTVAATLTRHAHCPVVVTREPEIATTGGRIVVGLDARTGSAQALAFALDEAQRRRLPLTLLVVEPDAGTEAHAESDAEAAGRRATVTSALETCARYPGVRVTSEVEDAVSPTRVLVDHGRTAALLIVGARPPGDPRADTSVSDAVLLHATCTVAVVRDR
jgi:nucleotide-binding universal stress UspA family protein